MKSKDSDFNKKLKRVKPKIKGYDLMREFLDMLESRHELPGPSIECVIGSNLTLTVKHERFEGVNGSICRVLPKVEVKWSE